MEDLRRQLLDLVETHRAELLTIPGVRDVWVSASNEIMVQVGTEVPEDKLTWIEHEGRRLLRGHPVVATRMSR